MRSEDEYPSFMYRGNQFGVGLGCAILSNLRYIDLPWVMDYTFDHGVGGREYQCEASAFIMRRTADGEEWYKKQVISASDIVVALELIVQDDREQVLPDYLRDEFLVAMYAAAGRLYSDRLAVATFQVAALTSVVHPIPDK